MPHRQTHLKMHQRVGTVKDWVVVILAIGLVTALNLITVAVLWDALFNQNPPGLTDNAVQLLTGWGGGIIGVVGAYVGYKTATVSERAKRGEPEESEEDERTDV